MGFTMEQVPYNRDRVSGTDGKLLTTFEERYIVTHKRAERSFIFAYRWLFVAFALELVSWQEALTHQTWTAAYTVAEKILSANPELEMVRSALRSKKAM